MLVPQFVDFACQTKNGTAQVLLGERSADPLVALVGFVRSRYDTHA